MKIQTFNNGKGLIHGTDPKRISSDKAGILTIGTVNIDIFPGIESVVPVLLNGCSGVNKAIFTSVIGIKYELEDVKVRAGRIVPPTQVSVDLMELRCRSEALEARCEALDEKIRELSNIFDTNSLNFIIK